MPSLNYNPGPDRFSVDEPGPHEYLLKQTSLASPLATLLASPAFAAPKKPVAKPQEFSCAAAPAAVTETNGAQPGGLTGKLQLQKLVDRFNETNRNARIAAHRETRERAASDDPRRAWLPGFLSGPQRYCPRSRS